MPAVIQNLLHSEKFVASLVMLIVAGVLVGTGHIEVQTWIELAKWVLTVYIAGKSVQGAAAAWGTAKQPVSPQQAKQALDELKAKIEEHDAAADAVAATKPR